MRTDGTGPGPLADNTSLRAGFALRSASLMVTVLLVPGAGRSPAPPPAVPAPMPTVAVAGPVSADTLSSLYSNTAAVPRGASRGTHTVDSPFPSWLTNSDEDARVSLTVTRLECSWPPSPSALTAAPGCRPLGLNATVRPASIVSAPLSSKPMERRRGYRSAPGCMPPPPSHPPM